MSVSPTEVLGSAAVGLAKAPTGIQGLDEVTGGGFPRGRPTLVTGGAGCGKTLLSVEFLVHGALDYGEPGVLLAFEESGEELAANVASLGFDLAQMQADGLLVIDAFRVDPAEIVETGPFDLDGLFIRLAYAVDSIGAKRVVLDTIEVLFGALKDEETVRAELGRLFQWLKQRGLTAVVTGEKGGIYLTRHGIEEYVSDCVITLDHRVTEQISTRRLRVVKYRGSLHGTNEFPFLITDRGLVVLPITSIGLEHGISSERVPTGVARLDHLLGGGIFRGSSLLVSGGSGTGKTTLAAKALESACERGERALFVSFEESPAQLVRNMASVGMDMKRWMDDGLLQFWAARPTAYGLEMHLATLMRLIEEYQPSIVAVDAIGSLWHVGIATDVTSLITREIDVLKAQGITAVMTSSTTGDEATSGMSISSLMDTWLQVRNVETNGENNRLLIVRKSRGTAHSNQVREFVMTDRGLDLLDVSSGPDGAVLGSARLVRDAEQRAETARRFEEVERRRRVLADRKAAVEAQVDVLRLELAAEIDDVERLATIQALSDATTLSDESLMDEHRWSDARASAHGALS